MYFATKALEVAERNQSLALRDMTYATEMQLIADGKVKNWTPLVAEAEAEVEETQQLMQEAEKTKSLGAKQASFWIDCREKFIDAGVKLNRALDRKHAAVTELVDKDRELNIKTEWLKNMNAKVEKAKKEVDQATENAKQAVALEA